MANALSNYISEHWAPDVQELAKKDLVALDVCDIVTLPKGDTYHKPFQNRLTAGTYTRNAANIAGGAVTTTDVTTTDEALVVDTAEYTAFYVDKLDERQMYYDLVSGGNASLMREAKYQLVNAIDSSILAEYTNAASFIDNTSIGGGAGDIPLDKDNVFDVIEAAKLELDNQDVPEEDDWVLILDPQAFRLSLERKMLETGFNRQDDTLTSGYRGSISGVDVYVSRNLTTETNTLHAMLLKKGAISFCWQEMPELRTIENPKNDDGSTRIGTEYIVYDLYGKKTFTRGSQKMVDIRIDRS